MVRRTSLILSEVLAGLLAGLVALSGLAAWRLHAGPVPLDFLTPHLESALGAGSGGHRVDIDQTVAVWAGWRNAIDIRATGVSVTGRDGAPLASVPEVSLGLSLRALAHGKLAPTSMDALRPSIRVVRLVSGKLALGFGDDVGVVPSPPSGEAESPEEAVPPRHVGEGPLGYMIDELLGDPDPSRSLGYLRRISVLDARIIFEDRLAGTYFRSPAADIVLLRQRDGVVGDAQFALQYDNRGANIRARLDLDRESKAYSASLDFRNIEPAVFAPSLPEIAPLAAIRLPLRGNLTLSGDLDGTIERIGFDVSGGAGMLDIKEFYRAPLAVGGLQLRGSVRDDLRQVVLDEAVVDLDGPTLRASGSFANDETELSLGLSGRLEGMPMADLDRYWPPSLAPAPRKWVTEHMRNGQADVATIEIALRRAKDRSNRITLDSIGGTLEYSDLSVDYLPPMPQVTGIDGSGTFDHDGLYLGVDGGEIGDGGRITGGQVDITGLSTRSDETPSRIVIDTRAEGGLRSAMEILDHEPLGLGGKLGFEPEKLGGSMEAGIRFEFPLVRGLKPDMLEIRTVGELREASVTQGPFGIRIANGSLALDLTEKEMSIVGEASLNGVPATIDWRERLRDSGEFRRRFVVAGRLGAPQRRALGLPDLSHWLEGAADTRVAYTVREDGIHGLEVNADLAGCLVEIPELQWRKPAGVAGRLAIDGSISAARGLTFDMFHLVTEDLDARLKMDFRPDMSDIEMVTIERAVYRGNDIQGTIARQEEGGYRIDVRGERIDIRHFLVADGKGEATPANGTPPGERRAEVPFFLKARFDEAITGENRRVHNAQFIGRHDGRNWQLARLDAQLDQGAALELHYEPDGSGAYDLSVESHDAGQALRTLDWFNEIQGGSLAVKGRRETIDAPMNGSFTVKDYRLVESPAGLRLLQLLTVVGLPAAVASKGVGFVSLDGSFSYDGGVLTFGNVTTFGASTGIHIDRGGVLNFNDNTVDVRGAVIPAYAAQDVIGSIPLIGDIITGGEGLIATNFRIVGKLGEPDIRVSPISTLPLPGFLRRLFRVRPQQGEKPDDPPGAEAPGPME